MLGRKTEKRDRFGELAIAMGFAQPRHIRKALSAQAFRKSRGDPVPLIGELMQELGLLTQGQANAVFERLMEQARGGKKRSLWQRLRGRSR